MDELYIEIELSAEGNSGTKAFTTIPSFVALYVYRYLDCSEDIKLNFVSSNLSGENGRIQIRLDSLKHGLTDCKDASKQQAILDLRLPVYGKDGDTYIAGMCAVCRELIQRQNNIENRKLLGFKESCLLAPSEASIWTRFCEVHIVQALSHVLLCIEKNVKCSELPVECVRFENHMKEPVRMHNIYKLAREKANGGDNTLADETVKNGSPTVGEKTKRRKNKIKIECSVPKELLAIEHKFAEGVAFTIADLILYPCVCLIYYCCPGMLEEFPLTKRWLNEIDNFDLKCGQDLKDFCIFPDIEKVNPVGGMNIPKCEATSLYKSDPKRYKPRNRLYTEQKEVDAVLEKLQTLGVDFTSESPCTYGQFSVDWHRIEPSHAESSALPLDRLVRKRQQLENLANAIVSLSAQGNRIVDFCSGTGHLGLLLALQLPQCTVILLENKAISLQRAKARARDLNLKNVLFYQCNIDYFEGNFNIGTSLHACGTATDIVLQQCRRAKANFVTCPCCYGSLQPMPHISYPLSKLFQTVLSEKEFMYVAHTADQAHALGTPNCSPETTRQGQLCMDIVDTDRKLQAEQYGYEVILTRLKPEDCTPKNRLLVGKTQMYQEWKLLKD